MRELSQNRTGSRKLEPGRDQGTTMALTGAGYLSLFLMVCVIRGSSGGFCYQCADTQGDGKCQTKIKTMAKAAYYVKNPTTSDEYLDKIDVYKQYYKDCTAYQPHPNVTFCVIETHEYRGQVNMFMRDCTDGQNFAQDFNNPQRPLADNQTYCDRKGDTGTYCVRMCREDFCNGPRPSSAVTHHLSFVLFVSSVFVYMGHCFINT